MTKEIDPSHVSSSPDIVQLPAGSTKNLLNTHAMTKIDHDGADDYSDREKPIEYASWLFKEDFLGAKSIETINDLLMQEGIGLQFEIPQIQFPWNHTELDEMVKLAREDDSLLMCVLRPQYARVLDDINLGKFKTRNITIELLQNAFFNLKPHGKEIFRDNIPYNPNDENTYFVHETMVGMYALPTVDVVAETVGRNYDRNENYLNPGQRRRTAVEAVWDLLARYIVTGKRSLKNNYDVTSSDGATIGSKKIIVGDFKSNSGFEIKPYGMYDSNIFTGMCPTYTSEL